jgi:hypothetical protein
LLKLGRLDNLTETQRLELENKISAIGESDLLKKFHDLLYSIGYSFPSPISYISVEKVYEYGRELALHKLCEEIDFISVINRYGYKGGGPELGKIVEALDYLQPENTIPMQVALYENIRRCRIRTSRGS